VRRPRESDVVPTLFDDLARTSDAVGSTTKRTEKVEALADVLQRLEPGEVRAGVAFLVGTTTVGRVGVGWAALSSARTAPAGSPSLTVAEVDRSLVDLSAMSGPGVVAARRDRLLDLFGRATEREQRLLAGVLGGELRQGALEGVMVTALARAAGVRVADVRRAAMMTGDLLEAAHLALVDGGAALEGVSMRPLRPVQPMLASPAADVADALGGIGGAPASVEFKLDGARLQAHRRGEEVRLYTRNLNDVTDRLPAVVAAVRSFRGGDLVLDGEVLGVDDRGRPARFQDTMGDLQRLGIEVRTAPDAADDAAVADVAADDASGDVAVADHVADVPVAAEAAGLRAFFFDAMFVDGSPIHDEPLSTRRDALAGVVPAGSRLPSIVTVDPVEAQAFLDGAIREGHEGVMVKGLDAPYEAGRRGAAWRKVKPVHTLDLVVLAAEWGHGRRRGRLSNLHLGARASSADNEFVMVGKTFKGLTDELLRWQTERFLGLEIGRGSGRDAHVVHVRPEQVVEVAVDGVQASSRYPGGVALRFARVRRYRDDKSAAEADTIDTVRAML